MGTPKSTTSKLTLGYRWQTGCGSIFGETCNYVKIKIFADMVDLYCW